MLVNLQQQYTLREKCPYSELVWSAFSRIRTEYGEIIRISPYSVRMRGNADQNNSEYGHFLRIDRGAVGAFNSGFNYNNVHNSVFRRKPNGLSKASAYFAILFNLTLASRMMMTIWKFPVIIYLEQNIDLTLKDDVFVFIIDILFL